MLLADMLPDPPQEALGPGELDAENGQSCRDYHECGTRRKDQNHSQGENRHTDDKNNQSSSLPIGNVNKSLDHAMRKPGVRGQPDQS
jgi:hypothetical protein